MNPSTDQLLEDVASRDKPGLSTSIKTYFLRHAQVFFYSLSVAQEIGTDAGCKTRFIPASDIFE